MAIGKNKKLGKKKGSKKKQVDPFVKKDWYDVKVPAIFRNRIAGKTPVRKSGGTKKDGTPYIATEALKGRVFEINLGDLHAQSEETAFRKMRLIVEEVKGKDALCNFYGMDFTRDKLMGLMRKWQTTIEGNVDVKTDDGYLVRMFCIGFTNRQEDQVAKTTYAQSSQVRSIRKKMIDVMQDEGKKSTLNDLTKKLISGAVSKRISTICSKVFPLHDVFVRKVKVLKRPKFDISKLMEVHDGAAMELPGDKVAREEEKAAAEADGEKKGLEGAGGRL